MAYRFLLHMKWACNMPTLCHTPRDRYDCLLQHVCLLELNLLVTNFIYCMYVCRFQNVVLRCPTPRRHCFLSSHWPSFRFLSFMAFLIHSILFFFALPRALFCFGIHFNVILGNLPSAILWTWPYHISWFCSISFIIGSSNPICCLMVTFLILSFLHILEDILRPYIVYMQNNHCHWVTTQLQLINIITFSYVLQIYW